MSTTSPLPWRRRRPPVTPTVLPPYEEMTERLERAIGCSPAPEPSRAARAAITGRRVLITGAGGSIGSELTRQVHRLRPAQLIMLDHDEAGLHALQLSLYGSALLNTPETVLADIRDRDAVEEVFATHRPEVVLHAAALKHQPLLQTHPREAWMTNVHGSRNIIEAAMRHDVPHLVNVSTDKAASPCSVLGRSKRLAEGITAHAATTTGRAYVSVRFGNVLGSRGSVVPTFYEQLRTGRPLTVTHPDVTRYLMSTAGACGLLLSALAVGEPTETLVLDMGEPVRILDIAQEMSRLADREFSVIYTGLRTGEKLHEDLFSDAEVIDASADGRFHHVHCEPVDPRGLPPIDAPLAVVRSLLVPEETIPTAPTELQETA